MGTPVLRRVLQACCLLLAVIHAVHAADHDSPFSTDHGVTNATRRMALVGRRPRSASPLAAPLGSGFWSVKGNQFVDAYGRVVRFSGLMWSGFESDVAVVQGLWARSYDSHLDQMRKLGFNTIRLPFAGDALEPSCYPKSIDYGKNPDLQGLNSLQVMDKIIAAAGKRGMKVILDYHQHHLLLNIPTEGLWYDPTTPPRKWVQRWVMLAKRYRGNPTVIGADLLNEPHFNGNTAPFPSPYWDVEGKYENPPLNFRTATKIVAAAIQRVNKDWIIFLEGMHNDYWWGGNCRVLMKAPLRLSVPNKLAYTAHEYGPFVYFQKFFNKSVTPSFPNNLPGLYNHHWGFIQKKGYAPVWVGEFGSKFPPPDSELNRVERTVFLALINYMKRLKVSWTFAFWGPLSKDTGGILNDDWNSVRQDKLDALKPIMYPNFA